jgi:hypothetical protein
VILDNTSGPALRFLRTAFQPDDWIALFLKAYDTGRVEQKVGALETFCEPRWQTWLSVMNAHRFNVYVSVNAIREGSTQRTRGAVGVVRHVFLEADRDGSGVLNAIMARTDLPPPSYVLHSSPNRVHVFWRVRRFSPELVEQVQKRLARELGTDLAATPCTQTTRLPGFRNVKYQAPYLVTVEYGQADAVFEPIDFPIPAATPPAPALTLAPACRLLTMQERPGPLARARRYLAAVPPAIAGQHGDAHTFRVCCRLVRGFALSDAEALSLLIGWNACCQPPWSDRELQDKLQRARRYGREPVGGLLSPRETADPECTS